MARDGEDRPLSKDIPRSPNVGFTPGSQSPPNIYLEPGTLDRFLVAIQAKSPTPSRPPSRTRRLGTCWEWAMHPIEIVTASDSALDT
jgi:hypothetical protein